MNSSVTDAEEYLHRTLVCVTRGTVTAATGNGGILTDSIFISTNYFGLSPILLFQLQKWSQKSLSLFPTVPDLVLAQIITEKKSINSSIYFECIKKESSFTGDEVIEIVHQNQTSKSMKVLKMSN